MRGYYSIGNINNLGVHHSGLPTPGTLPVKILNKTCPLSPNKATYISNLPLTGKYYFKPKCRAETVRQVHFVPI